ncbi:MAG: diguanylate cyclase [Terriglobia bacterium]
MKPRILIVDEDVPLTRQLERTLRETYEVTSVCRPDRALPALRTKEFDLVITAIQMQGHSGFEILQAAQEVYPLTEVILLTGEIPDRAAPAAPPAPINAHHYLLKPVRMKELKDLVDKSLSNQQQRLLDRRLLPGIVDLFCSDSLTGLLNRQHFESQFHREFERCERYDRPLTCLILDVDEFDKMNRTLGHRAGDRVLQQTGAVLRQHFRSSDLKCRNHGDAFILLAPEADKEVAAIIAEKLRRLVYKEALALAEYPSALTASIGVATYWRRNFASSAELLQAAELALSKAKQEGKNCVRVWLPRWLHHARPPASLPRRA